MSGVIRGTVSRDQLRWLGVNPECVVGGSKVKNQPIDVRYGDHRIVRSSHGGCTIHFGWFSEYQELSRKLAGKLFADAVAKVINDTWVQARMVPTK